MFVLSQYNELIAKSKHPFSGTVCFYAKQKLGLQDCRLGSTKKVESF